MPIDVKITNEFIKEITLATNIILNQNKLAGSDLEKSVEWVYRNNQLVLLANDYFLWVSTGRRPKARKVPIESLIKWMKDKGIAPTKGNYNSSAFAIQQAIYVNGIKARNYINPITTSVVDLTTELLSTYLAEIIATIVAEALTKTIKI